MTPLGLSGRWRMAALEPYTDGPTTTQEWLRALEHGADAAVRVVLEHLRDQITPIWDGGEQVDDAVSGRHIRKLLEEIGHA